MEQDSRMDDVLQTRLQIHYTNAQAASVDDGDESLLITTSNPGVLTLELLVGKFSDSKYIKLDCKYIAASYILPQKTAKYPPSVC